MMLSPDEYAAKSVDVLRETGESFDFSSDQAISIAQVYATLSLAAAIQERTK